MKFQIHRKRIFSFLFSLTAFLLLVAIFLRLTGPSVQAAWFDDSYGYRVKFTFTHNADITSERAITYTLDTLELTTANIMQSDCDDIRFTDGSGKVLRFQMTGSCGSATNTFEVVFPSIVNGTNVGYAYYSNPSPTSASVNVSNVEALTPSGGDPATQSNPTANDEVGPGPIAYWNFDEGQGSATQDNTSTNLDGTISGATWMSEDMCVIGKCLRFDGTDDRINMGDTTILKSVTALTVEAWIRTNTLSGGEDGLRNIATKEGQNSDESEFMLRLDTANDDLEFYVGGSAYVGASSGTINQNQWYHVVGTYDGSNVNIYLNGILKQSSAKTGATGTSTTPLRIGNSIRFVNERYWQGEIDDVKIFNYARTAAQVKADFQARGTTKGVSVQFGDPEQQNYLSNGLVGYWKMDETSTGTCSGGVNDSCDSSGNGRDADWKQQATSTSAKFSNGVNFDGNLDRVVTGSSINLSYPISLSVWAYPTYTNGTGLQAFAKFISQPTTINADPWNIYSLGSDNSSPARLSASISTGSASSGITLLSTTTITANTWYHVAMTYDGTTFRIFVNGKEENSVSTTLALGTSSASAAFGALRDQEPFTNNFFLGRLDEARIYNRALTPAEIAALYNWAPGPAGWWKLDENSGSSPADSSGNSQSGTFTGSPTWTAGKFGTGLNFDGSSQAVTATLSADPGYSNSVELWIYPTSSVASKTLITNLTSDSSSRPVYGSCTGTAIAINTWTHIAATSTDSTHCAVYQNGVLTTSSATTGVTFGTSVNIASSSFPGNIDDVRIYNYARTQKQILEDLNAGHPAIGTPVGSYVGYWKMDDATDTNAQDSSINNNDLTLSVASWILQGKFDSAWNGTGTSRVGLSANDADFDFAAAEDFSLSLWLRSDSAANPAAIEYLVTNGGPSGTAGYALYANTDGTLCFAVDDDTSWGPDVSSCTTADYYDAAWHHVIGVRDVTADKIQLYIDGILKDQDTDTTTATLDSDGTFRLGDIDTDDAASGEELAGDLDEVKVYRLALNASDVKLEYNHGSATILGSLSTANDGLTASSSAAMTFCIPGDTSTCNPPVGHWKFDENTGLTANDTSGNSNAGAITAGNGGWTAGKVGSAYNFDTSSTVVNAGTASSLDNLPSSGMTIEAWIYPKSAGENSLGFIMAKNVGTTPSSGWVFRLNSTTSLTFTVDGSTDLVRTTNTSLVTQNAWNHVAVSWDGVITTASSADIFINGYEAAYATTTNGASRVDDGTSTFYIGNDSTQARTFDGYIDTVIAYNYSRTLAQIAWDYNRGAPVGWYKFDECQGTTAYNSALSASGLAAGNNGTINPASLGNTTVGTCNSGVSTEMWDDGSTGKYSSALGFDGSDDNVTTSSVFNLGTTKVTIATWVYLFSTTESGAFVKVGDESPSLNGHGIGVGASTFDNTGNDLILLYEGASWFDTNRTIGTGWHHVALVTSPTGAPEGFIDGRSVRKFTSTGANLPTDSTKIGGYPTSNRFGNYLLDDVRIYNYSLTAAQIKTLYNEGSAVRFGPSQGSP